MHGRILISYALELPWKLLQQIWSLVTAVELIASESGKPFVVAKSRNEDSTAISSMQCVTQSNNSQFDMNRQESVVELKAGKVRLSLGISRLPIALTTHKWWCERDSVLFEHQDLYLSYWLNCRTLHTTSHWYMPTSSYPSQCRICTGSVTARVGRFSTSAASRVFKVIPPIPVVGPVHSFSSLLKIVQFLLNFGLCLATRRCCPIQEPD